MDSLYETRFKELRAEHVRLASLYDELKAKSTTDAATLLKHERRWKAAHQRWGESKKRWETFKNSVVVGLNSRRQQPEGDVPATNPTSPREGANALAPRNRQHWLKQLDEINAMDQEGDTADKHLLVELGLVPSLADPVPIAAEANNSPNVDIVMEEPAAEIERRGCPPSSPGTATETEPPLSQFGHQPSPDSPDEDENIPSTGPRPRPSHRRTQSDQGTPLASEFRHADVLCL